MPRAAICGRWVMLITCRFCRPISCMIRAIFSAIEPDTPVSISSKMIVGSFTAPAIMAFSDSITRAISPPEAIEATFCNVPFLLAEKRKVTLSRPLESGSLRGVSSTAKRTLGIPRGISKASI